MIYKKIQKMVKHINTSIKNYKFDENLAMNYEDMKTIQYLKNIFLNEKNVSSKFFQVKFF
jgi:hypothetical protein